MFGESEKEFQCSLVQIYNKRQTIIIHEDCFSRASKLETFFIIHKTKKLQKSSVNFFLVRNKLLEKIFCSLN